MINNLRETFQADTSLADISVEKSNTNNDVGQLAQLSDLLGCSERHEGSQTGSGKHTLQGSSDLSLDGVSNGSCQLDRGIVSDDMLLVLVQQVIEDLLVEESNAFEVVSTARLEAHNLIDQTVRLVRE